jgi:prepilin-type N-terminal cleavage/methylation domain-containing protein
MEQGGLKEMKNREAGFTLVEIVTVIAIISILSAIAIQNYRHNEVKAKAAQISSTLHAVEDAIIAAIIDGRTRDDFGGVDANITSSNIATSVLKSYLSPAQFTAVPSGIRLRLHVGGLLGSREFIVFVWVEGEPGTEWILDELEKMFPTTITHVGRKAFVKVDSSTLRVKTK